MTPAHIARRIELGPRRRRPGYPLPVQYHDLREALGWQSTIWRMAQAKTLVISTGCKCGRHDKVSLLRMYLLLGWNGSLWDRRHPCDHCDDLRHFMGSPGPTTVMRPMITGLTIEQLPWQAWTDGWRCSDDALIYPLNEPVWGWHRGALRSERSAGMLVS